MWKEVAVAYSDIFLEELRKITEVPNQEADLRFEISAQDIPNMKQRICPFAQPRTSRI
jgi:hypothetical protein